MFVSADRLFELSSIEKQEICTLGDLPNELSRVLKLYWFRETKPQKGQRRAILGDLEAEETSEPHHSIQKNILEGTPGWIPQKRTTSDQPDVIILGNETLAARVFLLTLIQITVASPRLKPRIITSK